MKGRALPRRAPRDPFDAVVGLCPDCGKKRFPSKAAAKAASRYLGDDGRGALSEYECGGYYHIGHLPSLVKRGVIARSELDGKETTMATTTARIPSPRDVATKVGVRRALKAIPMDEPGPLPEETCIVHVGPELAASWLLRNQRNRPIREQAVSAMARDMTAGKWRFTGASIGFDADGVLADGQHRLLALVKSHTTQQFVVVVGLAPEAMEVFDTGAKRSVADALSLRGDVTTAGNVGLIAAAGRIAVMMEQGLIATQSVQLTSTEVLDWVRDHGEIAEYARRAGAMRRHCDVPPAILAYAMWRLAQVDEEASAEFFADWRDLRTEGVGDPLAALMQRLRSAKDARERLSRAAMISMMFRAWNARRQGVAMRRMQATSRDGRIDIPEPK